MATISCPDCGTGNDFQTGSGESRGVCRGCGRALSIDERVVSRDDSDETVRSGGTLLLTSPPARPASANPFTPESLVDALESIRNLDIGHGGRIRFGPSEHQASHKVWVAVIDETGGFRTMNLD